MYDFHSTKSNTARCGTTLLPAFRRTPCVVYMQMDTPIAYMHDAVTTARRKRIKGVRDYRVSTRRKNTLAGITCCPNPGPDQFSVKYLLP